MRHLKRLVLLLPVIGNIGFDEVYDNEFAVRLFSCHIRTSGTWGGGVGGGGEAAGARPAPNNKEHQTFEKKNSP